jgi:hypothetical protein
LELQTGLDQAAHASLPGAVAAETGAGPSSSRAAAAPAAPPAAGSVRGATAARAPLRSKSAAHAAARAPALPAATSQPQSPAPYLDEAALAAICLRREHLTRPGQQAIEPSGYFGDDAGGDKKLLLQVITFVCSPLLACLP